jgi:hypothetical protein
MSKDTRNDTAVLEAPVQDREPGPGGRFTWRRPRLQQCPRDRDAPAAAVYG